MERIQHGNTEPHSDCQFKLIIQNAHKYLALVFSLWQGTQWDQYYCPKCAQIVLRLSSLCGKEPMLFYCNKVHCWVNVHCNILPVFDKCVFKVRSVSGALMMTLRSTLKGNRRRSVNWWYNGNDGSCYVQSTCLFKVRSPFLEYWWWLWRSTLKGRRRSVQLQYSQ